MLYNQVDEEFLDKRNYDPNKYIDKKLQKIVINPGVPYISTSNISLNMLDPGVLT